MTPDQYNCEQEMKRRAEMAGLDLAAAQHPVLCLVRERRIDPEGPTARFLDITAGRVLGSDELERIAAVLFGSTVHDAMREALEDIAADGPPYRSG